MRRWVQIAGVSIISMASSVSVIRAQEFNPYVIKAVRYLYEHHRGGGYDINKAFTHDIDYGGKGMIKASSPPLTMCVAGSSEVIIHATKIYAQETGDTSVFDKVPVTAWTRSTPTSLRANIFMYGGTGSRGTGYTLAEFGLGVEKRFRDLEPGDFVNLNRRNKSGHSVTFLGFLKSDLKRTGDYADDVVGFRYFSAQGKGRPDAGFAFRNAFFGSFCPSSATTACTDEFCPVDKSVPRDCGVIRSDNRALLNTGQMWAPSRWAYLQAVEQRKQRTRSILEDLNPETPRGIIDNLLDQELNKNLEWTPDQARAFDMAEPE